MPTNGMTIDGLNTVSALTAQDEVPVWDKEASGEPTRKITAQNMANSVKSLANLPNTTEMNAAIAQSTATLQGEIQKKASFKTVSWNQSTTTGTEYTSVVDINPIEYIPYNSNTVVFVRATYSSGRPAGLRIGTSYSATGDVIFYKVVETENYSDLSNGIFMCIEPGVKRLVIQEKLASNSGLLIGTAMILAF